MLIHNLSEPTYIVNIGLTFKFITEQVLKIAILFNFNIILEETIVREFSLK